jgi:signal transduction histidine kinase
VLSFAAALCLGVIVSVWTERQVTGPLRRFAAAARRFGQAEEAALPVEGPAEIRDLVDAFDEMRARIRTLLGERTRMLAEVSHDLRTPLTRMRLRAEAVTDPALRAGFLADIARIDALLTEALAFARGEAEGEQAATIDLPSLLQTLCDDFADVGHKVAYEGPDRLTLRARPEALNRAVANLVDNAVKFAEHVRVRLEALPDGGARIEVMDDGPGIPAHERAGLFQPYRTGRRARGGFGLGLAIVADIVRSHGGETELDDSELGGLLARITLPG